MEKILYRVLRKSTNSLQPKGTHFYEVEVHYCGYSFEEAARVFHALSPSDFGGFYGSPMQETCIERARCKEDIKNMEFVDASGAIENASK